MQLENLVKRTFRLVPSDLFHNRVVKVPRIPKMKKIVDVEEMRLIRGFDQQRH